MKKKFLVAAGAATVAAGVAAWAVKKLQMKYANSWDTNSFFDEDTAAEKSTNAHVMKNGDNHQSRGGHDCSYRDTCPCVGSDECCGSCSERDVCPCRIVMNEDERDLMDEDVDIAVNATTDDAGQTPEVDELECKC